MTQRVIGRTVLILLGAAVIGACHKTGTMGTAASPAVAQSGASPVAAKAAASALPAGVTTQMVAEGDSIFHNRSCRNCHGMDAKGGRGGPNLTSGEFMHVSGSYDDFVKIITSGVPADQIQDPSHHNPMPPRGGGRPAPLTDDQIRDVAAYIYSLNHK
jgi:mono/diheme cytochrome c family protein